MRLMLTATLVVAFSIVVHVVLHVSSIVVGAARVDMLILMTIILVMVPGRDVSVYGCHPFGTTSFNLFIAVMCPPVTVAPLMMAVIGAHLLHLLVRVGMLLKPGGKVGMIAQA